MIKLFSDSKGSYYMNQSEFLEKAAIWIEADKSSWTHITLLAYFCHRYKEINNVRFRFARWGGHPAKTKESRDFSRLIKSFLPEDFDNLTKERKKEAKKKSISKSYNYINWIFDYKFRTNDRSVTGTGIFLNHNIMNHFERMWFNHQNKKKCLLHLPLEAYESYLVVQRKAPASKQKRMHSIVKLLRLENGGKVHDGRVQLVHSLVSSYNYNSWSVYVV